MRTTNVIPGLTPGNVVLAATGSGNTLVQPVAATDANGQTTGTLASTHAEAKTVSVTLGGTPITQTALVSFTAGALDHFVMGAIASPQTAGTAFSLGIMAQDANNNPVTSFGGTVDLSTTAGTINPATSGAFAAGVLASQTVTVTGAGSGKSITATDHARTGKTGTSAGLTVNPGVATQTRVETAADGSGTVVSAQEITAGNSNTVYAITRADLSKICLLVRRRSQLEAPLFRPDEAAVVGLTRRA
jgi:hypothetical protein